MGSTHRRPTMSLVVAVRRGGAERRRREEQRDELMKKKTVDFNFLGSKDQSSPHVSLLINKMTFPLLGSHVSIAFPKSHPLETRFQAFPTRFQPVSGIGTGIRQILAFPCIIGKVVAKFCAKYLHRQVLKNEAYAAGDIGTSVQKAFFRMDEMMRGQRGWRELAVLGDKINKFTGMIEGLIWSPRSSEGNDQADDWAFEEGPHSDFSGPTSGSTACVAIIRNNQLVVANAGDSRCVISRKGQAYNLSRDHKPDLEIEKERILKAGGFIHAGRVNGSLNLARAIGDMEFKQNKFLPAEKQIVTASPDINTVELCDDDEFMVLACDGIWDCMTSQQLVDFVHEQLSSESKLSMVVERVLDKCLAPSTAGGEGCDNMTMILVQFKKPVLPVESTDKQHESPTTEAAPETDAKSGESESN